MKILDYSLMELDGFEAEQFEALTRKIRRQTRNLVLLAEAEDEYTKLITYALKLERPNARFTDRLLSTAYYELAYAQYLNGSFAKAADNFQSSANIAEACDHATGAVISKAIRCNIHYCANEISAASAYQEVSGYVSQLAEIHHTTGNELANSWLFNGNDLLFFYAVDKGDLDQANETKDTLIGHYTIQSGLEPDSLSHDYSMNLMHQYNGIYECAASQYSKAVETFSHFFNYDQIQNNVGDAEDGFDQTFIDSENSARILYFCALSLYHSGNETLAAIFFKKLHSLRAINGNHCYKRKFADFLQNTPEAARLIG